MISKKFLISLFVVILALSFLSQFTFAIYLNLINPSLKNDEIALMQAYSAWMEGLKYFNIISVILIAALSIVTIAMSLKKQIHKH